MLKVVKPWTEEVCFCKNALKSLIVRCSINKLEGFLKLVESRTEFLIERGKKKLAKKKVNAQISSYGNGTLSQVPPHESFNFGLLIVQTNL